MPSIPWALVTPSSRGIGFALTRHLLATTALPILATTRAEPAFTKEALLSGLQPNTHTKDTEYSFPGNDVCLSSEGRFQSLSDRLHIAQCDVKDEQSIANAAGLAEQLFPVKTHHLHLACAIPGILTPEKSLSRVQEEQSLDMFRVNAVGNLLLAKHFVEFLPRKATDMNDYIQTRNEAQNPSQGQAQHRTYSHLAPHATWLMMSARVGSTTDNRSGGWFSYRASKAAVNSLAKSVDLTLKTRAGDKAIAVAYHPGTVRTGLSRYFWDRVPEQQLFTPEYAAERMVDVLGRLEVAQRGRCFDWKGDEVPP